MTETQHMVLSYIWRKEVATRKEISRDLKMDLSSVTRALKPLMDLGIVEVVGTVSSGSAGRKSELISVNKGWKRFLGISIQRGGAAALFMNMFGEILGEFFERIEINSENVFDILRESIERFEEVDVVTIGIPGFVRDGIVEYSAPIGMENFDLKSWIEQNFLKKAYVVNDTSAAVTNFSDGVENVICFLVSVPHDLEEEISLRAGLWIRGSLYTGSRGFAGETGPGFKMGFSGTVEDLISGKVKPSKEFEDRFTERLKVLSVFLDPQMIILSGDFGIFPEESIKRMIDSLENIAGEVKLDKDGAKSVARGTFKALLSEMFSNREMMEYYLDFV